MDLEQLKPLRPFVSVFGILAMVALFGYLKSHPKYSQMKSVKTLERLENPSRGDKIYIFKVVVTISLFILVPLILMIAFTDW